MPEPQYLLSNVDSSVNVVTPIGEGFFEARYVHRPESDYFIAYVSSHNGCNKSCRFCHLTSTGQTMMQPATVDDLYQQVLRVLGCYVAAPEQLSSMHVNFMARGEPLANAVLQDPRRWGQLTQQIEQAAALFSVPDVSYRISTIMPEEVVNTNLEDTLCLGNEVLYYSLYSFNPQFRKRWVPKAIDPNIALEKLAKWQQATNQPLKIHFALIENQNDNIGDIIDMVTRVKHSGVECDFNLVRFNSPDPTKWKESPNLLTIADILKSEFDGSKIVARVGPDVYASCGVFYNG